jgi:hypothetical protein
MISTISRDVRASNDCIMQKWGKDLVLFLTSFRCPAQEPANNQISIVFHRQNLTALCHHLALWVLHAPCEDAPRLPLSAARAGPSR